MFRPKSPKFKNVNQLFRNSHLFVMRLGPNIMGVRNFRCINDQDLIVVEFITLLSLRQ